MLHSIAQMFRAPDLRSKLLFTLGLLVVYRVGTAIPAPFVDHANIQLCLDGGAALGFQDMLNMFSGGALLQLSIFALGVMPYITSSIIVQLLRVAVPRLERLHQEGSTGQAKLTQYTRYLTLVFAAVQTATLILTARSGALFGGGVLNPACGNILDLLPSADPAAGVVNTFRLIVMGMALIAGTVFVMWLGEQITERGIGNGMSLLIFTSIAATFPSAVASVARGDNGTFNTAILLVLAAIIMLIVVFVEQSTRRIPIHYAKRVVGRRTVGGNHSYLPIKVNQAGVIPVIFASSFLALPMLLVQFNNTPDPNTGELPGWVTWISTNLTTGDQPIYMVLYVLLIIGFAYFYATQVSMNPDEVAENMARSGGFIPGIRAGQPTADHIRFVLNRLTFPGSLYLGALALVPLIALATMGASQNFPLGGTSILIIVGVGLDMVKQIDAQLQRRHYRGLLGNPRRGADRRAAKRAKVRQPSA